MTSKITDKTVRAFFDGRPMQSDNTTVIVDKATNTSRLYMHGAEIARFRYPVLVINLQGWPTKVTLARLLPVMSAVGGRIWRDKGAVYWTGPEARSSAEIVPPDGWVLVSAGSLMEQLGNLKTIAELTSDTMEEA